MSNPVEGLLPDGTLAECLEKIGANEMVQAGVVIVTPRQARLLSNAFERNLRKELFADPMPIDLPSWGFDPASAAADTADDDKRSSLGVIVGLLLQIALFLGLLYAFGISALSGLGAIAG